MWKHAQFDWVLPHQWLSSTRAPSVINHQPIRPVNHGLKSKDWKKNPGSRTRSRRTKTLQSLETQHLSCRFAQFLVHLFNLLRPVGPTKTAWFCQWSYRGRAAHPRGAFLVPHGSGPDFRRVCGWNRWDRGWVYHLMIITVGSLQSLWFMILITYNLYSTYPPTPAFAKAGAAPGTTAGVEPVPFSGPSNASNHLMQLRPGAQAIAIWVCHSHLLLLRRSSPLFARLQRPKTLRGSFRPAALRPTAICYYRRSRLPCKGLKPAAAASTRYSCHSHLLLSAFEAAVCPPSKA